MAETLAAISAVWATIVVLVATVCMLLGIDPERRNPLWVFYIVSVVAIYSLFFLTLVLVP